ncbi:hypothetical protein THASP1DRAFT_31583 [Thamnocephalis sphaerospora]|uniref:Uncharacterized protein n=1 Tax=Thamnocephalis sphaerospora TaxID=78915 RepID=A0A4V1IW78_9FUNG|nr:hypothetical protein THASP1DRAFT_31583 [Thamnocephalis sphaerospora]|eukprot:RKP06609.1 hypothetical protein THASP1DRAFT_31583 [Thamnocephalis sphaerospora]
MHFTSLFSITAAVLAGIALAGSFASASSPQRSSNRHAPEAPLLNMAPSLNVVPSLNMEQFLQSSPATPENHAVLDKLTQGQFQLFPFAVVQPEGTKIVKGGEFVWASRTIAVLNMVDANGDTIRHVVTESDTRTGKIGAIKIRDYSRNGKGNLRPVDIKFPSDLPLNLSSSPMDRNIVAGRQASEAMAVYFVTQGNTVDAYVKMYQGTAEFRLENVKRWNRKEIKFVPGPRMTRM